MVLLTRQPHFLQASSSNPSSSNHHHVAPDSPQRPSRTSRGGGNYYEPTTPRLNDLDRRTRTESSHRDNSRLRSLQSGGGGSPDSLYELLEVPVGCDSTPKVQVKEAAKRKTTTNKKKPSYSSSSSSSSSSSDFATPQASPRVSRNLQKKKTNSSSGGGGGDYELVNLSYENFEDNPLLDRRRRTVLQSVAAQIKGFPCTFRRWKKLRNIVRNPPTKEQYIFEIATPPPPPKRGEHNTKAGLGMRS